MASVCWYICVNIYIYIFLQSNVLILINPLYFNEKLYRHACMHYVNKCALVKLATYARWFILFESWISRINKWHWCVDTYISVCVCLCKKHRIIKSLQKNKTTNKFSRLKLSFQTCTTGRRQVVNPRNQTPQRQSVAKPENSNLVS